MFDKTRILQNKKLIYVSEEQHKILNNIKRERNYHNLNEIFQMFLKNFNPTFDKVFNVDSKLKQVCVNGEVWQALMNLKIKYQQPITSIIQHYIEINAQQNSNTGE